MGFCFVLFLFFYFWEFTDIYYDLKDHSNQFLETVVLGSLENTSETWSGESPFCKSTSLTYYKNF